ncbi:MAG: class II aldolase/adducin family protein [Burkholderiales bacterium]|nr:class II aldolase/adducin family protein [Burkholderiales bacterium]OJW92127.1 MAG: class II aldolase [Burkholderiales bacterium 67-32]
MAKAAGRAGMNDAEWAARVDLAACYRLVAHFRMDDLIYNHISARVPGAHGHFLINPYGMAYEEITASSLIRIDLDGNVVDGGGQDYGVNHAGFVIHSAVHRARPEVDCVIHTHTPAGMAISALECGLLPLSQTAMFFGKVAMHEYEGVVVDLGEQQRLVADLGDSQAMILRNHGLLTVGPSIAEAFTAMYWLERACQAQAMAMACNTPLHLPAPPVVELTNHLYKPTTRRPFGLLEWPALLRLLDRRDNSYRS